MPTCYSHGQPSLALYDSIFIVHSRTTANISLEEPEYGTDPGLWKEITENIWVYWLDKGPSVCQNHDCDFQASKRHYSDQSLLFRKHITGEKIRHEWLTLTEL